MLFQQVEACSKKAMKVMKSGQIVVFAMFAMLLYQILSNCVLLIAMSAGGTNQTSSLWLTVLIRHHFFEL